ncbi:MAG: hypothetical protein RLY16_2807 [Bacteroidota bacterium]|jgi:hypothetical protein
MPKSNWLIDGNYLMERFPGKGGWTFIATPEIAPDKSQPFGWLKVKGFIDDHPIQHFRLMPMGNGKLFFPVKASLRKLLKKQAGDRVHLQLTKDLDAIQIPPDIAICLQDEPDAWHNFLQFEETEQLNYIQWIQSAQLTATRIQRIAITVNNAALQISYNTYQKKKLTRNA